MGAMRCPEKAFRSASESRREDASFLAQLTVEDATTPSEKVRGLITQAREAAIEPPYLPRIGCSSTCDLRQYTEGT